MADDNTIDDEVEAAPEAPEADAAVSEEPAAPAKRTRAKKADEPVADEAAEPAADDGAPVAEEAAAETPADDEAPAEEAPAAEAPARPARAPRAKKAADEAVAADAPAGEAAAEAPKKRTPRAKPLKKAARPKERKEHVRVPKPVKDMGRRKERRGIVVSAAMDKTITIRIDSAKPHPKYHKIVRRSTRLHAHDERNEAGVGDVVRIVETRPLSKLKRWRMVEIVEKAK
jgi:small subunit ribosomal protein S17